ncbi:MAG: nucleotidyltransferase family protein [Bryobacteraceae bacterium]
MLSKPNQDVPALVQAVLAGLNFSSQNGTVLRTLANDTWTEAIKFCDSAGLTIPLYLQCGSYLPDQIRIGCEKKLRNNAERWNRLKNAYSEIAAAFERSRIEFAVLKGFTQWPLFVQDPRHRTQYDIDLLLRPGDLVRAAAIAGNLGFEPAGHGKTQPVVDHFPTLVRKTGWVWRGDYFDPDIPFSLELHFRCWDRITEGFGPANLEAMFWERLTDRHCEELSFRTLRPADSVLYASLHLLRHLLRGHLRPSHVYELAWFLDRSADNDEFWAQWDTMFSNDLREYQAICFGLAHEWFSCALHPVAEQARRALPTAVDRWLLTYSRSPLAGLFKANKDELWLHWSLLKSPRQRLVVLRRRLLPNQLPGPVSGIHLATDQLTWRQRAKGQWTYLRYVYRRARFHLASLVPTSIGAATWMRWSWRDRWANRP